MRKQKGSFVPGRSGRLGTLLSSVFHCSVSLISSVEGKSSLEINVCIHHIKMTNKMQLCRIIYYSIVLWLLWILGFLGFITIIMLCMFRAILSLIIRRILTVITASGFTHFCRTRLLSWPSGNWLKSVPTQPWQQPGMTNVSKTRSCNYS